MYKMHGVSNTTLVKVKLAGDIASNVYDIGFKYNTC